jgi:ribose transport system ATP-binding protein
LQGFALWVRPVLGKPINAPWSDALLTRNGPVPFALLVLAAAFVVADVALHHTASGLRIRATGYSMDNARRNGIRVVRIEVGAYVMSGVLAGVAGLVLGAQIRNGDPNAGSGFILTSFAACVLGGASLWGGRGTFVGALLGALLLTMVGKVPSFIDLHPSFSLMITGSLTLLAAVLYAGREQWNRIARVVRQARSRV